MKSKFPEKYLQPTPTEIMAYGMGGTIALTIQNNDAYRRRILKAIEIIESGESKMSIVTGVSSFELSVFELEFLIVAWTRAIDQGLKEVENMIETTMTQMLDGAMFGGIY